MATKQEQYQSALTMVSVAVRAYATNDNRDYWNKLVKDACAKTLKVDAKGGDVQSTISDPLAYWIVPLYAHNCHKAGLQQAPRGRTVEQAMGQLVRVLKMGLTNRSDKVARISNSLTVEEMITARKLADEGYALAFLKSSSHNQEVRKEITKISLQAIEKRVAPKTVPAASKAAALNAMMNDRAMPNKLDTVGVIKLID
jgi:hypothetical protein